MKRANLDVVYTKALKVSGDLRCSYAFETQEDMDVWIKDEHPKLCKEYGKLSYSTKDLDGLKVGDSCWVIGEGDETFIIKELIQFSPNRPGFVLNSGFREEVVKCYKPRD